jgi:hypothetical protein
MRACPNIGPQGQDRRLRGGVVFFALTLVLAVILTKTGAAAELRWLLALPFFVAVMGISQALCRTCAFMALAGERERGYDRETVLDSDERSALRARGRRLMITSAVIAVAAAGLFVKLSA